MDSPLGTNHSVLPLQQHQQHLHHHNHLQHHTHHNRHQVLHSSRPTSPPQPPDFRPPSPQFTHPTRAEATPANPTCDLYQPQYGHDTQEAVLSSPNRNEPANSSRSSDVDWKDHSENVWRRRVDTYGKYDGQQQATERPEDPGGLLSESNQNVSTTPLEESEVLVAVSASPSATSVPALTAVSVEPAADGASSYANSILTAIAEAMGRPAMFAHDIDPSQITVADAFVLNRILGSLTSQLNPGDDLQDPDSLMSYPWAEFTGADVASAQATGETETEAEAVQQVSPEGDGAGDEDEYFDDVVYEDTEDTGGAGSTTPADEEMPAGMEDAYYDGYVRGQGSRSLEYSAEITADDFYEHGVDMQGIVWDMLPVTRAEKRTERLLLYANYENLTVSREDISKEISVPRNDGDFYRFRYTRLTEKCSFIHFQLRHLLWASTKHDVYYTHANVVKHWNPITKRSRTVMEVTSAPHVIATFKISTMCAREGIVVAGGFCGEYAVMTPHLQAPYQSCLTRDPNGIVNHILIAPPRYSSTTAPTAWASSNDQKIRALNLHTFSVGATLSFAYPINCSAISPDGRLLAVVGDDTLGSVVGADGRGDVVGNLKGHMDYGFACAWSPDGRTIATGNQDKTTRLYDLRYLSKSFKVLPANMGAVRSLAFSDDGRFLAMAEPADFVHLFDVSSDYTRSQVIDFFGEISGVSFSPNDAESLYIANADPAYGSILEFERAHPVIHMSNLYF